MLNVRAKSRVLPDGRVLPKILRGCVRKASPEIQIPKYITFIPPALASAVGGPGEPAEQEKRSIESMDSDYDELSQDEAASCGNDEAMAMNKFYKRASAVCEIRQRTCP